MINFIKTCVIRFVCWVSDKVEPFDDFNRRCPIMATGLGFKHRADLFDADLAAHFRMPNGITLYRLDHPLTIGDQALWHGIATAQLAFKYAQTKDRATDALLLEAVNAMQRHFIGGNLIRGFDDETKRIADDASNDTATGPLAGAYFAWLHGSDPVKIQARKILALLADELLANDYCLVKQDGTPTTYGRLVDGLLTDPVRVSLAMAILMAAHQATILPAYLKAFEDLAGKYRALLAAPILKFLWLTHTYDAHRAAIHLTILADGADKKTKIEALAGLDRLHWLERKSANPWIMALFSRHFILTAAEREIFRGRLLEFELEQRGPDVERINSTNVKFWKERGVRFVKWGGQLRATQPLPFWMQPSQDFFPQRHPFTADGWIGAKIPSGYHSGLDFLASYWLGVLTGLVGRDE